MNPVARSDALPGRRAEPNRNARRLTRRAFLLASTAAVLAGCESPRELDPVAIGGTALKQRASRKGLLVGAAVEPWQLSQADLASTLAHDFHMVVAENALKWGNIQPAPGLYNFDGADKIANFAAAHGMVMRGHTLLWHRHSGAWTRARPRRRPRELLRNHILTVAGRYRGRMHSWDVVNEAVEPQDGRADGLRQSAFLRDLGPDYLAVAFAAAAEADPGARLILNDYGLEWGWDQGRKRRRATLRLLETLLAKGVPVHGFGIQGHLEPGVEGAMDMSALGRFCDEVADLGLSLQITELDARDGSVSGTIERRDRVVADAYTRFLDVVLARQATECVLTWGITDRYSWLTGHFPRRDGDTVRGLPYDVDYGRKLAWYAMADAFDRAPARDSRRAMRGLHRPSARA